MLSAAFGFVVSDALLAEFRAVLVWPQLCKLNGLSVAGADVIQIDLPCHAIILVSVTTAATPLVLDSG